MKIKNAVVGCVLVGVGTLSQKVRKASGAALCLIGFSFSSWAYADSISFSKTFDGTAGGTGLAGWGHVFFSLPTFDPKLGTLSGASVSISLDANFEVSVWTSGFPLTDYGTWAVAIAELGFGCSGSDNISQCNNSIFTDLVYQTTVSALPYDSFSSVSQTMSNSATTAFDFLTAGNEGDAVVLNLTLRDLFRYPFLVQGSSGPDSEAYVQSVVSSFKSVATIEYDYVAAPIPEPETYVMLLAGLGLLGLTARRRKQKLNA